MLSTVKDDSCLASTNRSFNGSANNELKQEFANGDGVSPNENGSKSVIGNTEELQYLNQIKQILNEGNKRNDRTGTDNGDLILPLFTTKRVYFSGILKELLWFIRGCTDSNELSAEGVRIWDANGTKEFLDKRGLVDREQGDLGPIYGFQWRHFGAEYVDKNTDYLDKGVDQLKECIDLIKNDPWSRRIMLTAWNPSDLFKMALPPCHCMAQFYVSDGALSCQLYQRSGDMGLGVPFNVASYSLLTHMMAMVTGLKSGEFVHVVGDAHVYLDHIDALNEQLLRTPRPFPTLKLKQQIDDIDNFKFDDFELIGYHPHPKISMKMAV